jgi:aspartate aminotransferase-like enzyme
VYVNAACRAALSKTRLCPSFDLPHMLGSRGPVSTVASSALLALAFALKQNYGTEDARVRRFEEYRRIGEYVRSEMRTAGLEPMAREEIAAPNITTFPLPYPGFVEDCREAGYVIAHESPYLVEHGWGQIATMGAVTQEKLAPLFRAIARIPDAHAKEDAAGAPVAV